MDAQPLSPVGEAAVSRFAEQVFAHLGRTDQRRWARAYLQGLLAAPGRKSLANLAASLATGPTEAATVSLSLQQFINGSPWDWRPARRVLAELAAGPRPVRAWTAALAVVPKRGDQVVGVHRRFDPAIGRIVKCQVASGLFVATDRDAVPVDWSLLLDPSWTDDPQRRARARIPEDTAPQPAGELLVGMVDRLAAHHPVAPLVVGLDAADDPIRLAAALARRSVPYLLEVRGGQAVRPVLQATTGRHGRVHQGAVPAESLFPRWRSRTTAGTVTALRGTPVLPPGPVAAPAPGSPAAPVHRLWARCDDDSGPRRYWLTDLAEDAPGVLTLLDAASATRSTVDRLGSDFGLLDFSGRSYTGWHHHMTLVSAAYALGRDLAVRVGGSTGSTGSSLRDSA
ncbi:IS701 family transposase [Kitasatospora purpeofusca]|uniref:IS701 family transposase n=1 Tax=Kitasatospora purpeofusca TaxID=67352 RepID=UPI0022576411|nr:transposase [Kitasatospora purpeofusca]MCX4754234.1 transposase [Kitasatospora purpeofusca]WSR33670.1 transposase [Kitasatospora purpeofusca]